MKILKPEDWQKLKTLRMEGWKTDAKAFWGKPEIEESGEEEYWIGIISDPKRFYFGIEDGDQLVSMASGKLDDDGNWILSSVYTSITARGKGYSTQLVQAVIEEVKNRGSNKIMLYVTDGQQTAISMYEKMGFKHTGVEADCLMGDGQRHDELIMEKEL